MRARIAQLPESADVATTVVSYHEQSQGWLSLLSSARNPAQLIKASGFLTKHLDNDKSILVMPYDDLAADFFAALRRAHPRLGTMDLRIAAIAMRHDALLLSRNLGDFGKIPNLRIEDWTKG